VKFSYLEQAESNVKAYGGGWPRPAREAGAPLRPSASPFLCTAAARVPIPWTVCLLGRYFVGDAAPFAAVSMMDATASGCETYTE
jgi:hypothetical protein